MVGRIDVFVINDERILFRCFEATHGWKCGACGRGVVASRLPSRIEGGKVVGYLWHVDKCRVCHRQVQVVDHGYPVRPEAYGFHRDAFAFVSRPATLDDVERICKELGV